MSSEAPMTPAAEPPLSWPVLSAQERRVLGVLVEKAKTTPDVYPLSMNSLVTGCNQKSNRDPVLNLADFEVEEALVSAQKKGLATKITGGRVERWRHSLYEVWHVDKLELAVLAELLLRGPQTEGELRGRASRMEPIADLDALRSILRPLVDRGLVVYLTPEGRRGTILSHGFHAPEESERLRTRHGEEVSVSLDSEGAIQRAPTHSRPEIATPNLQSRLEEANNNIAQLQRGLDELRAVVDHLAKEVREIKQGLGL
jgi:uncharacterized protein